MIAERTGIDVISDFRVRDMAAGGQGAPLVPIADGLLFPDETKWRALQNLGGIGNVSIVPPGGNLDALRAFDTGPGNAPIDDWMLRHTGQAVDLGGTFAAAGDIDQAALAAMLDNPWFAKAPPKSLDRMDFGMAAVERLAPADGAATLVLSQAALDSLVSRAKKKDS